jgi:mRNA interferase RelE/StbE
MRYRIEYRRSVEKDLRKVPSHMRRVLVDAITALADDPRPHGVTKIRGAEYTYRIRRGDYRIIYQVYDDRVVVEVIKVGHRKDVYRDC